MRRSFGSLIGIAVALMCAGCGGNSTTSLLPKPEVMFFNSSPDAASLDFYVDSAIVSAALAFATGSDFSLTDPQQRDIGANAAGTTTNYDLILQSFARNKHYVFSSIGFVTF